VVLGALALGGAVIFAGFWLVRAPADFPLHTNITVSEGSSLREAADALLGEDVIRSPLLFQIVVRLFDAEGVVQAGTYTFPERFSVLGVARSLAAGAYRVPPTRITVFEGMRVFEIAELLAREHDLDPERFTELARPHEGYLFPDTYFIPPEYTEEDIVALMRDTFEARVGTLDDAIAASSLSREKVIIFASILEREARSTESMRTVAGILFARMEADMPLQVDAAFEYVLGRPGTTLTFDDLEIDSPYNTYRNKGLPPTPIANPGLRAMRAVLDPIETDYFFYLTAPDGTFHYSRTFEEHKRKKALYL
jgi:UPF0755 protein